MSGHVSGANLSQAVQDLLVEWDHTRAYWRDQKAQEFHQKYLEILPDLVTKANSLISEVDALLRKVRQDCE
ncbi:MAG: hypothetical protein K1X78_01345 [Verrucomicrobiaceae bacterium]|nr:hypothetical protein [Verrucomicrobiaceae bacterium]